MSELPDLAKVREVLIVKPSSLGDVVHALPTVRGIKETWPHLELRWIVNSGWAPVLLNSRSVAEVIAFPRGDFRGPRGWMRAARWMSGLGRLHPDVALDLQGLFRSAIMARASRARFVAGMSDIREGASIFHTHSVPVDARAHAVDRCWRVAQAFGVTGGPPSVDSELPPGTPVAGEVPERFNLVHPFARGAGKSLDPCQIAGLAAALAPSPVVIAGLTPDPCPPDSLPRSVIDLTNRTTLLELIWLMRRAAFVVSVDSGPMHLASALDRPLLAIHTWSDPRKVGPYSASASIWKGGKIIRRTEVDDTLASRSDAPDESALRAIADHVLERWPAGQS
jgi:heptosyltransferase-1